MRIPTGLNDGNLYRQGRGVNRDRSPHRRLLRLSLALVLVMLVMREAGNPNAYRIFFSDQPQARVATGKNLKSLGSDFKASSDQSTQTPELPPLADTVRALPEDARKSLGRFLYRFRNDPSTLIVDEDQSLLLTLADAAQLVGELPENTQVNDWVSNPATRDRLQAALDAAYLEQVDEAALWTSTDREAFYRLLECDGVTYGFQSMPKRAGVIAMLQQPDVYLHRMVAMTARVARITRVDAQANDFGIDQYFELWLQPNDASQRPVSFYTAKIPSFLNGNLGEEYVADGALIDIEGLYLKRIAFRSQLGSELAPVIVGRILTAEDTLIATPEISKPREVSWGLLVAISATVGIGLAIAIMIASTISARRLRNARRTSEHLAESSLKQISTQFESKET